MKYGNMEKMIIAMSMNGKSLIEIRAATGIPVETIGTVLEDWSYYKNNPVVYDPASIIKQAVQYLKDLPKDKIRLTAIRDRHIVEMYNEGITMLQISRQTGVARSTIYNILLMRGVLERPARRIIDCWKSLNNAEKVVKFNHNRRSR